MENLKPIILIIIGVLIGIFFISLLKDVVPDEGVTQLFLALLIIGICMTFTLVVGEKFFEKVSEVKKSYIEEQNQKKEEKEAVNIVRRDIEIYQNAKNSFTYFSDDKLMALYNEMKSNTDTNVLEQLAIEEVLVDRRLITHSPLHEKLYHFKKLL